VRSLLGREDIIPHYSNSMGITALWLAAEVGKERIVKMLLEWMDSRPNCPENQHNNASMRAAISGQEGIVKLTLGHSDVDPNYLDDYSRTPL